VPPATSGICGRPQPRAPINDRFTQIDRGFDDLSPPGDHA
jgi:hypothetical protein